MGHQSARVEDGQPAEDGQKSPRQQTPFAGATPTAFDRASVDDTGLSLANERLEAVEQALIAMALKIDALTLRMEENFARLAEMQNTLSSDKSHETK